MDAGQRVGGLLNFVLSNFEFRISNEELRKGSVGVLLHSVLRQSHGGSVQSMKMMQAILAHR